ncbi:hypothetical protein [Fusicatenibacter sp.]
MKHAYEKPAITVDAGMAEGVYAASGAATSEINYSELTTTANWGNDNGQAKFTLELSKVNRSQLKVVVSFNTNISNGWGGNSSASVSGSQLTLTWYEAPETAEIFVQADSNLNSLKITGATYSNK